MSGTTFAIILLALLVYPSVISTLTFIVLCNFANKFEDEGEEEVKGA